MWDEDPVSGLGPVTGDENNDFSLSTGGFSNLTLAYPSEHIVRRNLTLQPFLVLGNLWPDNPDEQLCVLGCSIFYICLIRTVYRDYYQYVDWMFAPEYVQSMVVDNVNYTGDFKAFQYFLEGPKVWFFICNVILLNMIHKGTSWTTSLVRNLSISLPILFILNCRLPGGDSSSLCNKNYTECGAGGPKWSNNG